MNVIITGASRGLGKAMAEKFAAGGNNLFLSARNKQGLEKTIDELKSRFADIKIEGKAADLGEKKGIIEFGQWLLEKKIDCDILINNAGSFEPGSVYDEPDGVLEKMIEVNLYSAYYLTRMLLPSMMQRKQGHIFNICSIAALQAYKNGGAYSISKFALLGFSKNLREEMKPYSIKVTAVLPGAAYTDSWKKSGIDPLRIMEANDIAEIVYVSSKLSPQACVEDIVVRPQLGDL